jgi:epoxyqueuosine reductase
LARECGFELAGVAAALPVMPDVAQYLDWVSRGLAGRMSYLTDHRARIRTDPRNLLASAKSVLCVGRLYNTPESGPVARYARTEDYHDVLRRDLEQLAARMREEFGEFEYHICVDTAPLLERSYARQAGLGWIGRNTCLINQEYGSYVLLAEMLTSLEFESDAPAPDRCGTCTRCIDACPTDAIVPGGLRTELDSTRCISYLTIELKGDIPEEHRTGVGTLAFGCDICQEVCPWNRKAPFGETGESPDLETLAELTPEQFREQFRRTPVWRTKYSGLLRNVAIAIGNSGDQRLRPTVERLAASDDVVVRSHAEWALRRLDRNRS